MDEKELLERRGRLTEFLKDMFEPLPPKVAYKWGHVYVRGLMLDGKRKSIEPMALRMPDGNVQAMQQFVGQSPWPWTPIRKRFAHHMISSFGCISSWIIDDTAFPKKGRHSVGVQRQYCNSLGKVANCQIGVSLHVCNGERSVPVDWSIYLPESWTQDRARCREAGVPEDVEFKTKWELALNMIDRAIEWGISPGIILADTTYGEVTEFRLELHKRKLKYALGIDKKITAWDRPVKRKLPPYSGKGRHPVPNYQEVEPPQSVLAIARSLPRQKWQYVTWREGTKEPLRSRFARIRVQPSHGHLQNQPEHPMVWLLIEWPEGGKEPTKYWFANLPKKMSLTKLVKFAKQRAVVEQDYEEMKDELGLDHFEGRGYAGWHHHVTLVSLAYGFLLLERLRSKKKLQTNRSTNPA